MREGIRPGFTGRQARRAGSNAWRFRRDLGANGWPRLAVAAALALPLLAVGAAASTASGAARATAAASSRLSHAGSWPDEVTGSQDNLRTGWDPSEPGLTPALVRSPAFGEIFSRRVNGQVYAQPLVVGSIVIVATENDWVYALNADTGAVIWSKSLGRPWPVSAIRCQDLTPNIGVTGAPVYDPATGEVYLAAEIIPAHHSVHSPIYKFEALSVTTGAVGWQAWIRGRAPGVSHPFDAFQQLQRPALLLLGGSVYAAFGSHCDIKPYVGYVAGVNTSTHKVTLWSDESGVTGTMAGLWQGGGGLMSDGPGRIFLASGNGVSPPRGPGSSPPRQLAESVVRLSVSQNGTLAARDFFSPANAPALDAADRDYGSGGPVGLPFGTSNYPSLLVQAGKDGRVFLLNRSQLGGREQGPHHSDAVVSQAGPFGGQWGHPAVFGDTPVLTPANSATASDYVYYLGRGDYLRALRLSVRSGKPPVLTSVATSTFTFGYTSGSPVVTSNGADPASAIVWVVKSNGLSGARGTLIAFQGQPVKVRSRLRLREIWAAPIGRAAKFAVPATSNGRVYVGTRTDRVIGFGPTAGAPLHGMAPVDFPDTGVGASARARIAVTAAAPVTVTGVTPPGRPFTLGPVRLIRGRRRPAPVRFPVRLRRGDVLTATAAFAPTGPGGATSDVSFATSSGASPGVVVPLLGDGTSPGLYAQPTALAFDLSSDQAVTDVPVGIHVPATVVITNGGATAETVTSVTGPTGPFAATGLPAPGDTLAPGQTLVVSVTFGPVAAGPAASVFTIATADGRTVTVHLSGTGSAPAGRLSAPAGVSFGTVRVGAQARAVIAVANAGNLPTTVAAVRFPGAPFRPQYSVPAGLPFNPGYDLAIPVVFRPTRAGAFTGYCVLTWTDRSGTHRLRIRLTGRAVR